MLLANDSDLDGDAFRFVSISRGNDDGRIIELPGGRFQFVPDENVTGPVSFSYVITDGRLSKTGTVTFDVAAVNDAPIANADGVGTGNNPTGVFVGDQDQPLTIDLARLIINDRDVEGDPFSLVEIFDGDNGDVVRDGDTAVFTPRAGYYGNAGFHYRVTDAHGATSIGYVYLTIMPEFDLPVAVSDAGFELLEDGYIDIDPALLMANDFVPAGTTPIFLGLTGAGVTALANGLYRFTPDADFFGEVTLSYAITNESGFAIPTTVRINVLPVSDNPVAVGDVLDMVEDQPLTIFTTQLLANDYDVDRQAIVLTRVLDAQGVSVRDNGIGQLIITPDADFNGDAWFDYEIEDSSGIAATARVLVSIAAVNDAPVIKAVPVLTGREDQPFAAALPAGTFSDVDGDALLIEARAPGGGALPEWLTFDRGTRTFRGTPPADFNGTVAVELLADAAKRSQAPDPDLDRAVPTTRQIWPRRSADLAGTEDQAFSFALENLQLHRPRRRQPTYSVTMPTAAASRMGALRRRHPSGQAPTNFHGTFAQDRRQRWLAQRADLFELRIARSRPPDGRDGTGRRRVQRGRSVRRRNPVLNFDDVDGDTLTLSVRLADGSPLPDWMRFENGRLTGTPPANFYGVFDIEILASDGELAVADVFRLTIDPSTIARLAGGTGRSRPYRRSAGRFRFAGGKLRRSRWRRAHPRRHSGGRLGASLLAHVRSRDGTLHRYAARQLPRPSLHCSNRQRRLAERRRRLLAPDCRCERRPHRRGSAQRPDLRGRQPGRCGDPRRDFRRRRWRRTRLERPPRRRHRSAYLACLRRRRFTGTPPADFNGILDIEVTASDGDLSVSAGFR
jgi:hypothetical protein